MKWYNSSKFYIVLLSILILVYPLVTIAGLEGSQRINVRKGTYKSCMESAKQSAPQLAHLERQKWCTCYADQVVDRVTPSDIKNSSSDSHPTPEMRKIAGDAIEYCQNQLYSKTE